MTPEIYSEPHHRQIEFDVAERFTERIAAQALLIEHLKRWVHAHPCYDCGYPVEFDDDIGAPR